MLTFYTFADDEFPDIKDRKATKKRKTTIEAEYMISVLTRYLLRSATQISLSRV